MRQRPLWQYVNNQESRAEAVKLVAGGTVEPCVEVLLQLTPKPLRSHSALIPRFVHTSAAARLWLPNSV